MNKNIFPKWKWTGTQHDGYKQYQTNINIKFNININL